MNGLRSWLLITSASLLGFGTAWADDANRPLRELVDQHIIGRHVAEKIAASAAADDAEFLRRVYLDLIGTIPTAPDARAFLDDTASNKREVLVDRLLASSEHARHLSRIFDVMLMERRADKHVPTAQWREFLMKAFLENRPWDQLVRELLAADGADAASRPAAKFFLDRDAEPTLLTRDVTRLFLGMNYQCAQCHDHPLVDQYAQAHYYGIYAFLNRTYLYTDKKNKNQVSLAEKADGEVKFASVFDKAKGEQTTLPRILEGTPIEEPKLEKGQEWQVAPADGVRPVPKFSRRAQFATLLPVPANMPFNQNIANRLWSVLMGRGLVHPLDMNHEDNPPSHPELLDALACRLASAKFDMRAYLRELALSQTYQRSSRLPDGVSEEPAEEHFAIAALRPLSPEQLAWATMQATGVADAARIALADKYNEQTLHDRLAGNVNEFIATFAGPAGEPDGRFQPSLSQALFLSNGGLLRAWLAPAGGNLVDRLVKLESADALAEEMYLSVLTRRPTEQERAEVAEYLQSRSAERLAAIQELVWSQVTSDEFRFNH